MAESSYFDANPVSNNTDPLAWYASQKVATPDARALVNPQDPSASWKDRQYAYINGIDPQTGKSWYEHSGGDSALDQAGLPQEAHGWLDKNLVGILAAALTGGALSGAMGGAGALGEGAGAAAGSGYAIPSAAELSAGGFGTGGMGLTGAGGIGSASSMVGAGIGGSAGYGAGAAATGLGSGLGAHFSDAGYAAEQNALNPSLGLDADYVGSGTGTGWDAGVTPESTQGPGGSPVNATTAGTPSLSSLQQKIASQLLKAAQSKLTGGGSGASGGMFGSSGAGYAPNQIANETPGMLGTAAAPQAQAQQAGSPHFLGGAQQPQLQGVGYMQVPQAQDPSQMMKLAQALQGQDQNYG